MTPTPSNQSEILNNLIKFAEKNLNIRHLLIETYKDGYFGINPKKRADTRKGKKFALQYLDSPGIVDLFIAAMREKRLNFKPHRSYFHQYKDKKAHKWVRIAHNTDLLLIEKSAFENKNKSAQTFLLECYINGLYGANTVNKTDLRHLSRKLEDYADDNPPLAELIILIWEQNLLGIKDRRVINQERFRINTRFKHTDPGNADRNPFAPLQNLISLQD